MLSYTKFRFCPRCGNQSLSIFEQNGMICNCCNLKYFHNAAAAVACILVSPQGVVLTERTYEPSKGLLDLPGGFVNYNESLEEALRREILEELNIPISKFRYLVSIPNEYTYSDITYFTTDSIFLVEWSESFTLKPNYEIAGIHFVHIEDIEMNKLAFSSTRKAFTWLIENRVIS
ncbi:MAG: NUDIX domain-containing protein [Chitinispirillaceae bacterium]|nr:NUDIX domain-containing protein [Chitinispirillaceae bacterium]